MAELVDAGQGPLPRPVEAAPATLRRAHAVHPIAALQTEYSLWTRDPEDEILADLPRARHRLRAYSPLGRGFLTGDQDARRPRGRRLPPRARRASRARTSQRNLALVDAGAASSRGEKGCTPAQLALAWVLAQGETIVPIPGTKRLKYLEENLGALQVELSAADLDHIESIMPAAKVSGARYPEAGLRMINR